MAKILIVDDDKDVVNLVRFIADREGHQFLEANDGKDGVAQAQESKPDLIIMDIMMPELDGHTASLELGRIEATRKIPIIVLTAKGNMRAAFEHTPNVMHYIEKPFEPRHLTEIIRKILPKDK